MIVSGGITKDRMSPCEVCSLRVKANSVLCVLCTVCSVWLDLLHSHVKYSRIYVVLHVSANLLARLQVMDTSGCYIMRNQ